ENSGNRNKRDEHNGATHAPKRNTQPAEVAPERVTRRWTHGNWLARAGECHRIISRIPRDGRPAVCQDYLRAWLLAQADFARSLKPEPHRFFSVFRWLRHGLRQRHGSPSAVDQKQRRNEEHKDSENQDAAFGAVRAAAPEDVAGRGCTEKMAAGYKPAVGRAVEKRLRPIPGGVAADGPPRGAGDPHAEAEYEPDGRRAKNPN